MKSALVVALAALAAATVAAGGFAAGAASGPSATGSGHLTYFDENEQEEGKRTFSFTAHQNRDGSADGNAHVHNRPQELKQNIDIDCLDVEGNTAWLGGVITKSTVSSFEGRRIVFSVQDNGEGSKAKPDRISFIYRQGSDPMPSTDCHVFHPAPAREVQQGNVQVRPT